MGHVNLLAVVSAAAASFVLGALWYSPLLFGRAWLRENGITPETLREASPNPLVGYGLTMLASLIASWALARLLITPDYHSLEIGIKRGFAAGACWVAMSYAGSYAFELRTFRHWAINGGFAVVQFTLMGAVLGVMTK